MFLRRSNGVPRALGEVVYPGNNSLGFRELGFMGFKMSKETEKKLGSSVNFRGVLVKLVREVVLNQGFALFCC